jgi:predicted peroxiredoxin
MSKKVLMMITHSTDDHDRANIALSFAASMISEDYDLAIVFIFEGAMLVKKGVAETIKGRNVAPAKDLMPIILESDAKLYVCGACTQTYGIAEDDMLPGVKIVSAPSVVFEIEDRKIINF